MIFLTRILNWISRRLPRKPIVHCRQCVYFAPTVYQRSICLHPESKEKHNNNTTYWFWQQKTVFDARFTTCRHGRLFVRDKTISQKIYEALKKDNLIIPQKPRKWSFKNMIDDWKHKRRMKIVNKEVGEYLEQIRLANKRAKRSKMVFK